MIESWESEGPNVSNNRQSVHVPPQLPHIYDWQHLIEGNVKIAMEPKMMER
jgi:hypothetical protein